MTRTLLRDQGGAAAIELALIAPLLASVLVLGWDSWNEAKQVMEMRTAVQTGARYYQRGGVSDTVAQAAANAAWSNKPSGGTLTVTRACQCAAVVWACTSYCTDNTPPQTMITLAASSSFSGAVLRASLNQQDVVRVR